MPRKRPVAPVMTLDVPPGPLATYSLLKNENGASQSIDINKCIGQLVRSNTHISCPAVVHSKHSYLLCHCQHLIVLGSEKVLTLMNINYQHH